MNRSYLAWLVTGSGVVCFLALLGYNTVVKPQPVFIPLTPGKANIHAFEIAASGSYEIGLEFRATQNTPEWWLITQTDELSTIDCRWQVLDGNAPAAEGNFEQALYTTLRLSKWERWIGRLTASRRSISLLDELAQRGGGKFAAAEGRKMTVIARWSDGALTADGSSPHLYIQLSRRDMADNLMLSTGVTLLSLVLVGLGLLWLGLNWFTSKQPQEEPPADG